MSEQSRLLTSGEMTPILQKYPMNIFAKMLEAQDAKTASIVRAETLEAAGVEIFKVYQQYDEDFVKTEDDSKVVEKIGYIGWKRWQQFKEALKDIKQIALWPYAKGVREMDINKEYLWCPECDAYRKHRPKRWESSIAVIIDEECVRCGYIFNSEVRKKVALPDVHKEE